MKKNPTAIEDYSIVDEENGNQELLRQTIGVQLLKRDNEKTDLVRFNVVFSPNKLTT